jgi:hypothetical protein
MNRKTPSIFGIGFGPTTMKCAACKNLIPRWRLHKIGIYYEYYYDFTAHFHLTCRIPKDLKNLTGKP